jgi:8-oxo-dGTP pyrophosphatase MutT (NUDIX family)
MKVHKQTLKRIIKEELDRLLNERRVWGIGGGGMLICCLEDKTVFLQKRGAGVTGGAGQWAFPGGGIHPEEYDLKRDGVDAGHFETPIPPEMQLPDNSPRFLDIAFEELHEEHGWTLNNYKVVDEYIYNFEGFKYKTLILVIPMSEKQAYTGKDYEDEFSWEHGGEGWFTWPEMKKLDLFFGFTPELLQKLEKVIG